MGILRKRLSTTPTFNSALALALLDSDDTHAADLAKSLPAADQKVFSELVTALHGIGAGPAATTAQHMASRSSMSPKSGRRMPTSHCRAWSWPRTVSSFGVYSHQAGVSNRAKAHSHHLLRSCQFQQQQVRRWLVPDAPLPAGNAHHR